MKTICHHKNLYGTSGAVVGIDLEYHFDTLHRSRISFVKLDSSLKGKIMSNIGNITKDQLKQFIERLERLEAEKTTISEDIKEVFAEAKFNGYDVKTLRQILKIRKMNPDDRTEQEILLDTYLQALGMAPAPENDSAALPSSGVPKAA